MASTRSEVGPADAWAQTVLPGAGLVDVQREALPRSKSGPGLCPKSPDEGRHHWYLSAVGAQSLEVFVCGFCDEEVFD
jgi:hypothetical protein